MITTIKFAKLHQDAKIPTKRYEDAGLDLYPVFDTPYMVILPHETFVISTGLCAALDPEYCLIIKERSSTGSKGIGVRAGVIDSGYRGDIGVAITNHNNVPIIIIKKDTPKEAVNHYSSHIIDENAIYYPYEKAIAQALVVPVPEVEIEEYTVEEINNIPSERGIGAYGSSSK